MNSGPGLILIDRDLGARLTPHPGSHHLVVSGGRARVRWVRLGDLGAYLPAAVNLDRPMEWERVAYSGSLAELVRGRVCPLPESQFFAPATSR